MIAVSACLGLPACAVVPVVPAGAEAALQDGPAPRRTDTPLDGVLACLDGRIGRDLAFSVGAIADATGKEQYAESGTGKFVTQGAGDMVQSALFAAGLTVVNRRDPNIPLAESNWGIRDIRAQAPTDFFITGSINSLDFLPGAGAEIELAGVGPRYRQSRILIGLDLAMTAAHSGVIVANTSIQKQFFADELGFSVGRFFDTTLANVEAGRMQREAVNLALRHMLTFATIDLLAQVMGKGDFAACAEGLAQAAPAMTDAPSPRRRGNGTALAEARAAATSAETAPLAQGAAVQQPAASGAPPSPVPVEAQQLGNAATSYAAKAIAAADSVLKAPTREAATAAADEALRYMTLAIQALREAAAKGLAGPEGDAVATLVEKAITAAQAAQKYASEKAPAGPQPAPPASAPVTPEDKRLGGPATDARRMPPWPRHSPARIRAGKIRGSLVYPALSTCRQGAACFTPGGSMKKLLATTAVSLVAFSSAASAQSVLERVLGQIDNSTNLASVNGTFANIAENIGGQTTVYFNPNTNVTLTAAQFDALASGPVKADYTVVSGDAFYVDVVNNKFITKAQYDALSAADKNAYKSANGYAYDGSGNFIGSTQYNALAADSEALNDLLGDYKAVTVSGLQGINGSITNVINGLDTATMVAAVGQVTATEFLLPTVNLGSMATTVLGAVNTGEITLGVNQSVNQAKTTSTGALSSVVDQIGGSASTGALVLNIASNMTGVNGSISNTMTGVNGAVGAASTTVLGAVNTGTITSGVNAAVTGIVGGTSQTGGIAP